MKLSMNLLLFLVIAALVVRMTLFPVVPVEWPTRPVTYFVSYNCQSQKPGASGYGCWIGDNDSAIRDAHDVLRLRDKITEGLVDVPEPNVVILFWQELPGRGGKR